MNIIMRVLLIALLFLFLSNLTNAQNSHIFVKLESNISKSSLSSLSVLLDSYFYEPLFPSEKLEIWDKQLSKRRVAKVSQKKAINELSKWIKVQIPFYEDNEIALVKWRQARGIEFAEFPPKREITLNPNDSILSILPFDYYNYMGFYEAWDISTASDDIVIAIIDSGVDYNHPDLVNKLWINEDEIADNGIDDDENGFVDDRIGWDFWQSGDYSNATEDNDPLGEFQDHGTHVAGIAAAQTNNRVGIPGTGFNARYMAVKAGGTREFPREIAFGYEGILYAAVNGADIINCSWGGDGFSNLEYDVINVAIEAGALVVGASGNSNLDGVIFPAAYPGVLSVGAVNGSGTKASYSNYGSNLDVLATGTSVRSTVFNDSYSLKTGTSMAAPMVAGLAALIRHQHPEWSTWEILGQIRATSSSIDDVNPSNLSGKLGKGVIRAALALGEQKYSFYLDDFSLVNENGDKLRPNENGKLRVSIRNTGIANTSSLVSIEHTNEGISIEDGGKTVNTNSKNGIVDLEFNASIANDFDSFKIPEFTVVIRNQNDDYEDRFSIKYDQLLFEEHSNGDILVSLASDGTIGFVDPLNASGGVGFISRNESNSFNLTDNVLFSSSLMISVGDDVADRAFSFNNLSEDIRPTSFYNITEEGNTIYGYGEAEVVKENFPSFDIITRSYTINSDDLKNSLFVNYTLLNTTSSTLNDIHIGLFTDWDIPDYASNRVDFNQENHLIYVFNEDENSFAGVSVLNELGGAIAIDNAYDDTITDIDFGIYYSNSNPLVYDGFTKLEKAQALNANLRKTSITSQGVDASTVIYTGPYSIGPQDSLSVGFVLSHASSDNELIQQIQAARSTNLFEVTVNNEQELNELIQMPKEFEISKAFPNPFNPETSFIVSSPVNSFIDIEVYDQLGRIVKSINQTTRMGRNVIKLNLSNLSSGRYFIRFSNDEGFSQTRKVTLLK